MKDGGQFIVAVWGGFLATLVFWIWTDGALAEAAWCAAKDDHCLREWIGATSGWAATIVGGASVFLLLKQVSDAREAVQISSETLNDNRRSAEREQRAYVYGGDIELNVELDRAKIVVQITNHGQTPAYDVKLARSAYFTLEDGYISEKQLMNTDFGDIAPMQSRWSTSFLKTPESFARNLSIGHARVKMDVIIGYTDIFNQPRATTFSVMTRKKTRNMILDGKVTSN